MEEVVIEKVTDSWPGVGRGWYSRGYRTADLGLEEIGIAEVTVQLKWGWKRLVKQRLQNS